MKQPSSLSDGHLDLPIFLPRVDSSKGCLFAHKHGGLVPCHVMDSRAVPGLAVPCHIFACHGTSVTVIPCHAMSRFFDSRCISGFTMEFWIHDGLLDSRWISGFTVGARLARGCRTVAHGWLMMKPYFYTGGSHWIPSEKTCCGSGSRVGGVLISPL